MEKMAIVQGSGANSIEIISMVFSNYQTAYDYVVSVLGEPDARGVQDGNTMAQWDVEEKIEDRAISDKFFKSYYGGCGECYTIEVMEIDAGIPLVHFNLD